ncbi:MAG: Gfo/Idh/MocA family oxidoreductase [Phycisphaeraceae bacterium]
MSQSAQFIRIGIVGCGHVTQRHHLPTLTALPDARVVAVADIDPTRRQEVAKRFDIPVTYDSHTALLADPQVDVVAVLVPPQHHVAVALAALKAGKHVFVEKPLANNLDGTDELVAVAAEVAGRAPGVKSTIGFMLRSHRLIHQARQVVQSGTLGTVEMIRTVWTGGPAHRLTHPQWIDRRGDGGGVLVESGVHHYDLWRYLLQDEITQVTAIARAAGDDDACATVSARLASGALASSVFSKGTSDCHQIDIYGDKGRLSLSVYRSDGLEVFSLSDLSGGMKARLRRGAAMLKGLPQAMRIKRAGGVFSEAYPNEWRSFLDAVRHNRAPVVSLEDGRRSLCVGLAAAESAQHGQPVDITTDYRRYAVRKTPAVAPERREHAHAV